MVIWPLTEGALKRHRGKDNFDCGESIMGMVAGTFFGAFLAVPGVTIYFIYKTLRNIQKSMALRLLSKEERAQIAVGTVKLRRER